MARTVAAHSPKPGLALLSVARSRPEINAAERLATLLLTSTKATVVRVAAGACAVTAKEPKGEETVMGVTSD